MHSLKTANEMNVKPTGNARIMNAEHSPLPRMSNTTLKSGKWSVDELIHEAREGYLVKGFKGGVVEPITGQFTFGASECFKIVNGEIGEPLRDVTLAGNILETLKAIKVGKDVTKTRLTGTCGKAAQHLRVGDYCPSILVKEVIVGGSA
jgi:TldD protein